MPKLSDFSVGDAVSAIDRMGIYFTAEIGCIHTDQIYLKNIDRNDSMLGDRCLTHSECSWRCEIVGGEVKGDNEHGDLTLIKKTNSKKPNKFMSIIEKIKEALLSEPDKTLIKADMMHKDGSLTDEGKELFFFLALTPDMKKSMKAAVDGIEEENKETK
jgi:hypothetical protein